MFLKKVALAGSMTAFAATAGYACEIGARVSIVGNEFAAIQAVGAAAQECTGASVESNLTSEHQTINVAGLSGNPSEYTTAT
ncbi:MAG: sugar ABC transporter substrate-binding protein, partial [Dinoroseobacter sp.]|nr:sugar ABC transporter substrate-binding protein [Dinoroseobacter sp.]